MKPDQLTIEPIRAMVSAHKPETRVFGLDILRAIAILLVVYWHEGRFIVPGVVSQSLYAIPVIDGVGIFFVLSGFLIGGILLRTMAGPFQFADLWNFWIRRWFRTLPNYYLVLIVFLLPLYTLINGHKIGWWWAGNLTFTQNLARPAHAWLWPDNWSLSVEEWFYAVVPLILYVLCRVFRNRQAVFIAVALGIFMFSLAVRLLVVSDLHLVICRLDSIMLGCVASWIAVNLPLVWSWCPSAAFLTGLALWVADATHRAMAGPAEDFYYRQLSFLVVPVGTMLMLPLMAGFRGGQSVPGRVTTFIAKISYSMYLVNSAIVYYILERSFRHVHAGPAKSLIEYALSWPLTIGIAWGLYTCWEIPMMKLRDRKRA